MIVLEYQKQRSLILIHSRGGTMCKFGYCRISTKRQSIERQVRNIKEKYPDTVIVTEVYTGTSIIHAN